MLYSYAWTQIIHLNDGNYNYLDLTTRTASQLGRLHSARNCTKAERKKCTICSACPTHTISTIHLVPLFFKTSMIIIILLLFCSCPNARYCRRSKEPKRCNWFQCNFELHCHWSSPADHHMDQEQFICRTIQPKSSGCFIF